MDPIFSTTPRPGSAAQSAVHSVAHSPPSAPTAALILPQSLPTIPAMSPPSPAVPVTDAHEDHAGLNFSLTVRHDHRDLVQVVAFNTYGDRCATGSVDGKIRVFNRSKDGVWRACDRWGAHGGEVLELQWLPATVYPNLIASLGIEGKFKLWAEDPSAAPGRRFHNGGNRTADGKPAYETRSASTRSPYRSFSMRHADDTRTTHLALLATDGRMSVFESDEPERLAECASIDEFSVLSGRKPARGEEVSFKVRFDMNPEPCYSALRAGVAQDSLGMVVAAMNTVKIFRSRDVETPTGYGITQLARRFYCVVEVSAHRGLVRDVAWAPGNIRGYDTIATAGQDGIVRVFRIDTPVDNEKKSWSVAALARRSPSRRTKSAGASQQKHHQQLQHQLSGLSASLAHQSSLTGGDRAEHPPGHVVHVSTEISRLDCHGSPVWRVGFDDDGQILGSTGDDGRLMCYRQRPDGVWAKSSELGLMKARMLVPQAPVAPPS